MIIYEVVDSYFDGCEFWETSVDLFSSEIAAIDALIILEENNTDKENQSYFIKERQVK